MFDYFGEDVVPGPRRELVAHGRDDDETGAGYGLGDGAALGERHEWVLVAVDDKGGGGDLRQERKAGAGAFDRVAMVGVRGRVRSAVMLLGDE